MSLRFWGPALAVPLIFAATAPATADEAKAVAKPATTTTPAEPGADAAPGEEIEAKPNPGGAP